MRRRCAAIGIGFALIGALAACGGDGGSDGPATTSAAVVLTSAQLGEALLTVDELPPGWSRLDSTGDLPTGTVCPAGAEATRTETLDRAQARFTLEVDHESEPLGQILASAPDAEAQYADLEAAYSSCVGQSWTVWSYEDSSMTATMAEVPGPKVADESVSYQLTYTETSSGESMTSTSDMTLARRATVVELYWDSGQLGAEEFASIIDAGDQKVAAALDTAASS